MSSFYIYSPLIKKNLLFRCNSRICRNDVLYQKPRWENEYDIFKEVGDSYTYERKFFIPIRFRSKTAILKYYETHD